MSERTENRILAAYVIYCALGLVTAVAMALMGGLS